MGWLVALLVLLHVYFNVVGIHLLAEMAYDVWLANLSGTVHYQHLLLGTFEIVLYSAVYLPFKHVVIHFSFVFALQKYTFPQNIQQKNTLFCKMTRNGYFPANIWLRSSYRSNDAIESLRWSWCLQTMLQKFTQVNMGDTLLLSIFSLSISDRFYQKMKGV